MRKYLIFCALALMSCSNNEKDRKYIMEHSWKFVDGYHIGDGFDFTYGVFSVDEQMNIYKKGDKLGKVNLSVSGDCLEIISLNGEKGIYVGFGAVKKK